MEPLTKQEIKNIIEGKRTNERIPNLCEFWIGASAFEGREEEMQDWLDHQVYDIDSFSINMPASITGTETDPEYCWLPAGIHKEMHSGIDSHVLLEDWEDTDYIEEMYEKFPSPEYPGLFSNSPLNPSKYNLGVWCFCLFERHWSLRGMENALTDYLLYPDEVHRLFQKLTDFYIRAIERAKKEKNADGIFITDDIGTQTGPFFSLDIFRTFFKPYYKQMIDKTHELGMHFWMHTCGNIELFLPDLIEIGLDVIHPIQKYTMDEKEIAQKYGGQICFLVGFDVQKIIPFGTPEEVRVEARHLINTFFRPEGKFMMTMGNGATKDWKKESLQALYEEIAKGVL